MSIGQSNNLPNVFTQNLVLNDNTVWNFNIFVGYIYIYSEQD